MNDNDGYFMSEDFPGLVSMMQDNDLKQFADARAVERDKLNALRAQDLAQGLNISELAAALSSENAVKQLAQLATDLDKMQQDAAEAAAKKEATDEQLPQDRFPSPPTTA